MNAVRPPTFRPRTARRPLCAVELKRSPRLKIAGSNQALRTGIGVLEPLATAHARSCHRPQRRPRVSASSVTEPRTGFQLGDTASQLRVFRA